MEVLPGCAYVMPPNKDMALVGGALRLMDPEAPRGLRLPIDYFFRSLAAGPARAGHVHRALGHRQRRRPGAPRDQGRGRHGHRAGRRRRPRTTACRAAPSPPASSTTCCRRPRCRRSSSRYAERAFGRRPRTALPATRRGRQRADPAILHLLRDRTGHDFSHYKRHTIAAPHRAPHGRHPDRAHGRLRRASCAATRRGRGPVPRAAHRRHELLPRPRGLRVARDGRAVPADPGEPSSRRAACASGCRAAPPARRPTRSPSCCGSTAERRQTARPVQIFATDIDDEAIERARAGRVPRRASPRTSRPSAWRASSRRTATATGSQDDPRPDRLRAAERDQGPAVLAGSTCVSCRNLLIYMDGDLQRRLMPLFHYALNPDGYLFLGTSETVGGVHRPLRRRRQEVEALPAPGGTVTHAQGAAPPRRCPLAAPLAGAAAADAAGAPLRVRATSPSARCSSSTPRPAWSSTPTARSLYIHGRTGRYLEPAAGEPSDNILKHGPRGPAAWSSHGPAQGLDQQGAGALRGLRVQTTGTAPSST